MQSNTGYFRFAQAAVSLAVVIAVWIAFAPTQFGGRAGFVVLTGNSMAPEFEVGDLVIVRHQTLPYQIGDIVAYDHPEIGIVFHRIVDVDDGSFVLQGDNNAWLDSYEPTLEDIVGKLWWHVPAAGLVFNFFRTPIVFSILIGLVAIFTVHSFTKKNAGKEHGSAKLGSPMYNLKTNPIELLFSIATVGLLSLILGLVAFLQPASIEVPADIPLEHVGAFFYTADADPNVYDAGTVQPGEPIFRRLTDSFIVGFAYEFLAENAAEIGGEYQLIAEVSDSSGWKRTLVLAPQTEFLGASFSVSNAVELRDVQELITRFETQTGLDRTRYMLSIKPMVAVRGEVAGYGFQDQFAPALTFLMDDLQLQLMIDDPLNASNSLQQRQVSMIPRSVVQPNTISLLVFDIPVPAARWVSAAGVVVSLLAIALIGQSIRRTIHQGEAARNELMYAPLMIKMENGAMTSEKQVVQVSAIDDLAKLAERKQGMILHDAQEQSHDYYLEAPEATYHYQVNSLNGGTNGVEIPAEIQDHSPIDILERLGNLRALFASALSRSGKLDAYEIALESWVRTLEMRNQEEIGHSRQLSEITASLAQELGIKGKQLESIRRGSLLHDIGFMNVPESIIQKPGKLSEEEWDVVRQHPDYAEEILAPIPYLKDSLDIPRYHHERWDGSGYPYGLQGEEIPLGARIFAVADVYYSLMRDRPDRRGWSKSSAREYIEAQAGWEFDPKVVEAFLQLEA